MSEHGKRFLLSKLIKFYRLLRSFRYVVRPRGAKSGEDDASTG